MIYEARKLISGFYTDILDLTRALMAIFLFGWNYSLEMNSEQKLISTFHSFICLFTVFTEKNWDEWMAWWVLYLVSTMQWMWGSLNEAVMLFSLAVNGSRL